ncbi:MAG TPA: hypothetical protein VF198_04685 [Vicinamibacterales bacterium]
MTSTGEALLAGTAGALALTTVHEVGRRTLPSPPRMDIVGMRALAAGHRALGAPVPSEGRLYYETLAGDVVSNALYYAMVPGRDAAATWRRGLLLGGLAGIGAVMLPRRMGLGDPPNSGAVGNQVMTVAWYVLGGLAAACTALWLRSRMEPEEEFLASQWLVW